MIDWDAAMSFVRPQLNSIWLPCKQFLQDNKTYVGEVNLCNYPPRIVATFGIRSHDGRRAEVTTSLGFVVRDLKDEEQAPVSTLMAEVEGKCNGLKVRREWFSGVGRARYYTGHTLMHYTFRPDYSTFEKEK